MRFILLIISILLISGCGGKEVDITAAWSAEQFYRTARSEMSKENYLTAIDYFETLESRFPFGKYATQAQLDVAYAYYKYNEPDSAIAAVERFIKLNPRHETVDYAYYLRGLINFSRGGSILDNLQERDRADYDKSLLLQTYADFKLLITRFPKSRYAEDAHKRLLYLRNEIARADLKIALFYVSRKAWVAVANRTRTILLDYPGSTVIKQTLEIQLQAYQALGLEELERDTQRIIDLNYKT